MVRFKNSSWWQVCGKELRFFRKPAIGLSCRKCLLPVCKLKFSKEVYDQDVISTFISGSSFLQRMASIITVKENFYFLILRDFVLGIPWRIFLLLPVQKECNSWSGFSKFHCGLQITAIVRTFLVPLQVEQVGKLPHPRIYACGSDLDKHMAASTGCIPKEKMVGMLLQICSYISQGIQLSSYVLTEPTLWKSHGHEGISLRNYLMDCSMWMLLRQFQEAWGASGIQPGPAQNVLVHLWGWGELQIVLKREVCARERQELGTKEISKLPVSWWAEHDWVTVPCCLPWFGFITAAAIIKS